MPKTKLTPMLKQYLSIKDEYPDTILFYRMGDFYEMFFEDAKTASRILDITLTSRNKNAREPVPMCGVPYRAVKGHIARLLEKGFKVAICDQVEDPSEAKGLVKRDVVRVVTPGMIIENELLEADTHNFILALCPLKRKAGISFLDISTGTFRLTEAASIQAAIEEVISIGPREVLIPDDAESDTTIRKMLQSRNEGLLVTAVDTAHFQYGGAGRRLLELFDVFNLEGFGCEGMRAGVGAAGALLAYVEETQKQSLTHLTGLNTYYPDDRLILDDTTCRNLELLASIRTGGRRGTLLDILDHTVTAMGGRRMRDWIHRPLRDAGKITRRQATIAEALGNISALVKIRDLLKSVYDLERLTGKLTMGHANARDLVALKQSLFQIPLIMDCLNAFEPEKLRLSLAPANIEQLTELAEWIEKAVREDAPPVLKEGGMIREGYHDELDELIHISRDGKAYLAQLEAGEKEKTGITTLKVRFNKVFGYYIEVSRSQSESVPGHYVRKQTLVNAERYITDELKQYEEKVLGAEDRRIQLEFKLFNEIRETVASHAESLGKTARFISRLDCLTTLAHVADQNAYHRPTINTDGVIDIEDGRHPVIEKMITAERFVPNSIHLDNEKNQIMIITGPNMAGKSTVLRQVALMTVMAQMGSFVPAKKASVCIVDRIFSRVGALDNLAGGLSTFMVEMQETAGILNGATPDSLVIMDEIGRGTSTFDGLSIAWAVAGYLHDLNGTGVKTLFATHYHELTALSRVKSRVCNYNIAVKEWNDRIVFLRKLVEGGTNRSYGIQVARLAGIPPRVIGEAKKYLSKIETKNDHSEVFDPSSDADNRKRPVQLSLFNDPKDIVISRLKNTDIHGITPLDALNHLDELVQMAKKTN